MKATFPKYKCIIMYASRISKSRFALRSLLNLEELVLEKWRGYSAQEVLISFAQRQVSKCTVELVYFSTKCIIVNK